MQVVNLVVNGEAHSEVIDERTLLLQLLRDVLGLTGTHNGCMEARCGCCAVLVDGQSVKSCNVLALQVEGKSVQTVEGLAEQSRPSDAIWPVENSSVSQGAQLTALQESFRSNGAVQCGFCTPGMLIVISEFLEENASPTPSEVRDGIRGNLCRCTGYQKIIDAVMDVTGKPVC